MQPKSPNPPPAQFSVTDIYYVLFKHKWLILIFTTLGLGVAAAMWVLMTPPYVSEAKLQIQYVEDPRSISAGIDAQQVRPVDPRGEGILAAEALTLTSLDVAANVVEAIGIEQIVGKGVTTNREVAALALTRNLQVDVPKRGNVLVVRYQHPDIAVVQPTLRKLIEEYYEKHVDIYKNLGALDNFLTQETDKLRQNLTDTERELRELRGKAGLVSLEETRKTFTDRYTKLRQELDSAEAELSERVATLKELQKHVLTEAAVAPPAETNVVVEPKPKLPADLIADYRRLVERLEAAYKEKHQLLADFTEASTPVKSVSALIATIEARKKEMETANPQLTEEEVTTVPAQRSIAQREQKVNDLTSEYARVAALQARVQTLTEQFNRIKADAGVVDEIESSYLTLQRKKERQEALYKSYTQSLDKMKVDAQLGAGRATGISEIQSPSLPMRDMAPLQKKVAMASVGGIGLGIALAFLLEMFLGQRVTKPSEVENSFHLPVFLTVPRLKIKRGRARAALTGGAKAALPAPEPSPDRAAANGNGHAVGTREENVGATAEIAPWEERHELYPYCEALRDRLVSFFELKGLTHKPKLVGLTSCSQGAGVTSLAAGLAASLSETGEGNVLLVDLNMDRGAAHPFFRGKPALGLADVLEEGKRQEVQVQENLYAVQGTGMEAGLSKVMPKRLAHLLPQLHASDYDYIIFDMPPVTQTSVTPRLSGFMDMVFMVVEDQKTNRDWLKQASGLLQRSKANVGAVYNKRRSYAPRWLHQEF